MNKSHKPARSISSSSKKKSGLPIPANIAKITAMKINRLIPLSAAAILAASCANQQGDGYDTIGYDFDDYGTPDGAPYQEVNPVYDSAPAYVETSPPPARPATPARPTRPSTPARTQSTHTVVRGDTLWGLSRKYGVSVDAIKTANNMRNDTVVLGSRLVIPAR